MGGSCAVTLHDASSRLSNGSIAVPDLHDTAVPRISLHLARETRERFVAATEGVDRPELAPRDPRAADGPGRADRQRARDAGATATISSPSRPRRQLGVAVAGGLAQGAGSPRTGRRHRRRALNSLSRLELIGDEVVENSILSSRLAQMIQDKASFELNDLRLRIQHLEGISELDAQGRAPPGGAGQGAGRPVAGRRPEPRPLDAGAGQVQQHMVERGGQGLQGRQCLPDRARA